jgi:cytochrome P450
MRVPPGPRGMEVVGFVRNPVSFLAKMARTYGPVSYLRLLGQRLYLIDDAELIQEVLVTRQHLFERDTGATLLRELVGDGLLTRDEPLHRERRRALQPAFHRAQVASYAGVMAREASTWNCCAARFDVTAEMRRLTLSIVGATLFGADFRESADRIAEVLGRVIRRALWIGPFVPLLEPMARAYRRRWPHGRSLFFPAERRELERILNPVIEARRAGHGDDILSLLLDQLDDRDAVNEIVTLVLAGHETTSTALTWAWHLLAANQRVARKMQIEIDERPDCEDYRQLPYTGMVFTEAMRLYPPAPAFGRRPKEDILLGGYEIPAGSSVFVSPYVTQRNERYFAQPGSFEPERWEGISIPKFAYFPFGGGAKMCIGDMFARMEGVLVLASIARNWRLVADSATPVGTSLGITLRPDGPVWMRKERR